jgi:hypothetical protein
MIPGAPHATLAADAGGPFLSVPPPASPALCGYTIHSTPDCRCREGVAVGRRESSDRGSPCWPESCFAVLSRVWEGCDGMGLWRRPGAMAVGVGGGGWAKPALRLRCAVVPPWARAWRGGAALQPVQPVGTRVAHRLMSSAAQGTADREEGVEGAQLDGPAATPELELTFTASQVETAVQRAAAGAESFDGDLDAKFGVLSACAGLLGGHRIPSALLHTIQTPQQLTAYYVDLLVPSDSEASLSVDDLPPNLVLDDRDEDMVERVLRTGAE